MTTDRSKATADEEAGPLAGQTPESVRPVRPWGSLAYPSYRLLWASLLFSTLAFQMGRMLNLWHVYELSGSALQLGLTGLFQAVPLIVFGLLGGTAADVLNRKLLLLASQAATLVLSLALAALTLADAVQVWHIYAVTAGLTVVNIVDRPARMSIIPALVPQSHLLNAITLHTTVMQLALLLGPLLAGLAITRIGIGDAYLAVALAYLPVIAALALLRVPTIVAEQRPRLNLAAMWEGLRFVTGRQVLLALLLLDTTATFFGGYRALMPIFAEDILRVGPAGFGALMGAPAVGALAGTAVLLGMGRIRRMGLTVILTTALYAGSLALFGASPWFLASLALAGLLGFWDSFGMSIRQTVVQMATPDHLRGRANAILQVFTMGAPSLGYVQAGIMASLLGAPGALVVGAGICGAVVLTVGARWRGLRDFTG
jgi:MFS family permease